MSAKALKCNQCNTLLANVKEAQAHNEITGHTSFEETTEELKLWRCVACGKMARTVAEKDMHTRFTTHADFVEATANAEGALNTEAQMADARSEMEIEEDAIRAALGKAPKKKEAATSDAAAGSSGAAEGSKSEGGASEGGHIMVAPAVDEAIVTELESMGFGRNRAVRAVYHSGGSGVEGAVNWIMEHEGDADIDTPLLVTQASEDAAAKLTPEERRQKAQELLKAAREKREREEKELAAHRERERIRAGKELQAAKRKEDEGAMKRLVEVPHTLQKEGLLHGFNSQLQQRQREKEEEAAARAKIQARLEEDRRERRRKLGLPEELTEEEKAREAQKAAEKAAAKAAEEKKKIFSHVRPVSTLDKMRSTLVSMKKAHAADENKWRTAATTLNKYIANIAANPEEEKFRNIKTSNAAFQQRVASAEGGTAFLELCGFQLEGEVLSMPRDKVDLEVLQAAGGALTDMLNNPFFGAL